jgi:hypothetical protein
VTDLHGFIQGKAFLQISDNLLSGQLQGQLFTHQCPQVGILCEFLATLMSYAGGFIGTFLSKIRGVGSIGADIALKFTADHASVMSQLIGDVAGPTPLRMHNHDVLSVNRCESFMIAIN